jgi:hypothetical protein
VKPLESGNEERK